MIDYDGVKMDLDQVKAVLESSALTLTKAKKYVSNLSSSLKTIGLHLEVEQDLIKERIEDPVYSKAMTVTDNLYIIIRRYADLFYKLSQIAPARDQQTEPIDYEKRYYRRVILPQDTVRSYLETEAIYVRTPMLRNLQRKAIKGDKGRTISNAQSSIFREPISYSIMLAENYSGYDFSIFERKIIHFLFVYHDLPGNMIYICDNDNHETKPVIDAITKFLPNGDYPLTCEIHASAVLENSIPEGTYITVTKLQNGFQSHSQIIDFWKKKMDNQDKFSDFEVCQTNATENCR